MLLNVIPPRCRSAFRLIAIAAASILWTSAPVWAADQEAKPDFAISASQVPRYLDTEDLREWRRLENAMEQAQADLETGNWLANKRPTALTPEARAKADNKKGEEMAKTAQAEIAKLQGEINALHAKASERFESLQAKFESNTISLEVPLGALEQLTDKPTEELLVKLWNDDYNLLFFDAAYALSDRAYLEAPQLSDQLRASIRRIDGNRYTLAEPEKTPEFSIVTRYGKPLLEFEDRSYTISRFKAALILAEVVFDVEAPAALYCLYAFDLESGRLIDQSVRLFPATEANRQFLGIPEQPDPATETPEETSEAPTVAANPVDEGAPQTGEAASSSNGGDESQDDETGADETPGHESAVAATPGESADPSVETVEPAAPPAAPLVASPLLVTLHDEQNFLGRLEAAKDRYVFRIEYIGEIDGFDHHAALVLNRELLLEQGFTMDSFELIEPFYAQEGDRPQLANVVWRVTPTTPVEYGQGRFSAKAIAIQGNREAVVDVGKLTVDAHDGQSPQAAIGSR